MEHENIAFTCIGPVLELADGTEVTVNVSTVETEENQPDHHPDEKMMMYLSQPDGYAIYGEEVDGADAAVSFEEV